MAKGKKKKLPLEMDATSDAIKTQISDLIQKSLTEKKSVFSTCILVERFINGMTDADRWALARRIADIEIQNIFTANILPAEKHEREKEVSRLYREMNDTYIRDVDAALELVSSDPELKSRYALAREKDTDGKTGHGTHYHRYRFLDEHVSSTVYGEEDVRRGNEEYVDEEISYKIRSEE